MPINPHIVSRATARRWRIWEYVIVIVLAVAIGWSILSSADPEPRPLYIDTAYPLADFHCPEGYDGPNQLTEHVVRCTLHTEEK